MHRRNGRGPFLAVMRRRVANTDVFRATWEGMWDEGAGDVVDL